MDIYQIISVIFEKGIFLYAIVISSSYFLLSIYSAREMVYYMRKNKFVEIRELLSSPLAPGVSIIAPAYNESMTIVENIRSLLSLYYQNYELIIINDGSSDDTLKKIIEAYNLVEVPFAYDEKLKCKPMRGFYKSTNKAFSKLLVVDKQNGGKADAINAGINISSKKIYAAVDVDCILNQDTILRMVKPFMEELDHVIATGGVIRIANSCHIENGRIIKVNFPEKWLARFQTLEYIRAFLLGRMAWSKLNGLLLVSGALGFFEKQIVIDAGGYRSDTVGEDIELIVRMRRMMTDRGKRYKIVYIPDPLCWTEAPEDFKILSRQRNRWTRGTAETLIIHKGMFLNPRYKLLGMLSFPYWFLFEWMAPLIEFFGILYLGFRAIFGLVYWKILIVFLALVFSFSYLISTFAVLYEELSFPQYRRKRDVFKLVLTVFLEPFLFHPLSVLWSIEGNIDLIRKKKSWGDMQRKGFKESK